MLDLLFTMPNQVNVVDNLVRAAIAHRIAVKEKIYF